MANIKFTEFPSATVVGSMDIIPIVQDGANKKTTASVFSTYIGTLFVNLSGTQTITGSKTFSSQLISSVATGTAPFSVASTTKVTNLNADLLDGYTSADFQLALTNPITGTGTTNYLPKFTGTSALGNSSITDDGTGIGLTISGYSALTLNSTNATDWGSNIKFEQSGTTYGFFGSYGSLVGSTSKDMTIFSKNAIRFNTNNSGTSALIIDTANAATFSSSVNVGGDIILGDYATATTKVLDLRTSNSLLTIATDGTAGALGTTISYSWANGGQGPLKFNNGAGEVMRLSAGGNVLIGTTTDAGYKLDVNGTARVSGALTVNDGVINNTLAGSTYYQVGLDGSANYKIYNSNIGRTDLIITQSTGAATFSSSVTAGGFVNIKTSTAYSDLNIGDGSASSGITIKATSGSTPASIPTKGLQLHTGYGVSYISSYNSVDALSSLYFGASNYYFDGGPIAISNSVTSASAVVSTHKVQIVINGTTYYLLATT